MKLFNIFILMIYVFFFNKSYALINSNDKNICSKRNRQECLLCCDITTKISTLYNKYCIGETASLTSLELNKLKNDVSEAVVQYKKVQPDLNPDFYNKLFDTKSCLDIKVATIFDNNTKYDCSIKCKAN